MKTHNAKRILSVLLTVCMLASSLTLPIFAADTWEVKSTTRIYVATDPANVNVLSADDEAIRYANLFAMEYEAKMETKLSVVCGAMADAKAGDIILVLDSALSLPAEGYSISISSSKLTVSASTSAGLLYGCHDVLKQLKVNGTVEAVSNEAPDVAERSISLDNGRKYYSVDWIKELIREMSWAGMNTLVMHFSEEMGLGLESKLYPWLNGRDGSLCTQAAVATDNTYLTQEEFRDIAAYAKLYKVDLVPSLDSPGHMNYIVKKFNEKAADGAFTFTYNGTTYTVPKGTDIGNYYHYGCSSTTHTVYCRDEIVHGSRNGDYSRGIDISNSIAVAFTKSLISEYAELFKSVGATKIDIGGDELLGWGDSPTDGSKWKQLEHWEDYAKAQTGNSKAVAYDAFLLYMNSLNDMVRDLGYTSVRMWNDDVLRSDTGWSGVVQLDDSIDVWYWTAGTASVTDYIDNNHSIYNIYSKYCYFAMTDDYKNGKAYADAKPKSIYENWNPYVFDKNVSDTDDADSVLGGAYGIWSDNPTLWTTEDEVMDIILPIFRAIAAKSWETSPSDNYATYTAKWDKIGSAPAVTITFPDTTALQALIAEFDTYKANESAYTVESFTFYENEVNNAKAFIGQSSFCYSQDTIDGLAYYVEAARDGLVEASNVDPLVVAELEAAIEQYKKDYTNVGDYPFEYWVGYADVVQKALALLASDNYTTEDCTKARSSLKDMKGMLEEMKNMPSITSPKEGINSAVFQASRVYQGANAKLVVSTVRSLGVFSLIILDENGIPVVGLDDEEMYVEQAYNRRKATVRNFTVTIPATEVGTHTYTVYAAYNDANSITGFSYTSDPITVTLIVKE